MPFPKDAKQAADVANAQVLQLSKWEGGVLCLIDYEVHVTYSMGNKAILHCVTEAGEPVNLFTFSTVVLEQLEAIKGDLPNVIITPQDTGTYQTIY